MKRSAIAARAGWWWSCICRCCGTTADAEIAGDIGCLGPCPPSISAAASRSSTASDVGVRFRPERGEKGLHYSRAVSSLYKSLVLSVFGSGGMDGGMRSPPTRSLIKRSRLWVRFKGGYVILFSVFLHVTINLS